MTHVRLERPIITTGIQFHTPAGTHWLLLTGCPDFKVQVTKVPNCFHRWTQRIFFGFKYIKI